VLSEEGQELEPSSSSVIQPTMTLEQDVERSAPAYGVGDPSDQGGPSIVHFPSTSIRSGSNVCGRAWDSSPTSFHHGGRGPSRARYAGSVRDSQEGVSPNHSSGTLAVGGSGRSRFIGQSAHSQWLREVRPLHLAPLPSRLISVGGHSCSGIPFRVRLQSCVARPTSRPQQSCPDCASWPPA